MAKKLKGYLIEKYNNMGDAYTCRRLVEEARKLDCDLQIVGINDCMVTADGIYNLDKKLDKVDFVINRYKWGKAKDEINQLAARTYNPIDVYDIYINKYEQVKRLRSDFFVVPNFILGTSGLGYDYIKAKLGDRFVAKGLESSMGEEILLVENEKEYKKLSEEYPKAKEWLFEEFVTTSFGKDMRFYSIRGQVVAAMERKSKGDFRANVALGASVRKIEITEELKHIAADIYGQTGLDFLGIDLMYGTTKPYFCEINVMPGLEGIEKASGENVARKIIETIIEDSKREE